MLRRSVWVVRDLHVRLQHVTVLAIIIGLASSALAQSPRYEGRLLPEWEADLRDLSVAVRLKAVEALGHFETTAVPALARALGDGDQSVGQGVERQLYRIGPAGIPGLAALQGQPTFVIALKSLWGPLENERMDSPVRKTAVQAVQTLPSSTALPVLMSGLRHSDSDVRSICHLALGAMGPAARSAVPALAQALKDATMNTADFSSIGFALGAIGGEAVPILLRGIKDPKQAVRTGSVFGLFEFSQGVREPYANRVRPINTAFRDTLGPRLAAETAESLIPLMGDSNMIDAPRLLLVALVPPAVGPMVRALNQGDEPRRRFVLNVFRTIGEHPALAREATAELRRLAVDPRTKSAASAAMQAVERRN